MRDLKHLIEFENLLDQAHNSFVAQARKEGKKALGYTCNYMPEVLLDLPGCVSVRLRAPGSTSPDMATYYLSSRTCHYGRSLMERALEGGYNFLDAQMATETCTVTCRFQEHLQRMDIIENPDFFVEFTDVPFKKTANSIDHYCKQLEAHVLTPLHEHFDIDISDDAIMKAIEEHNEVCRLITEIGSYRKLDRPTITGYEFAVIQLVTLTCPKYLILPALRETAEEMKTRKADERPTYKIKVVLSGAENDDPAFTQLIESCGALVVADRYCYGSIPGREEIVVRDGETPLYAIARHYLESSQCPRFMPQDIMRQRKQFLADVVREYKADGLIVVSNKFCEYWSYERMVDTLVMPRDFGIPTCSIEKEYVNSASGQLRTRFQAFVESVELKKLQKSQSTKADQSGDDLKLSDIIKDEAEELESRTEELRGEVHERLENRREELHEKFESRKEEIHEKLENRKDELKEEVHERLEKVFSGKEDIDGE